MRLTVVGCSGSMPGPHSPASCYLLEADGFRLVVDLGSGALGGRPAVRGGLSRAARPSPDQVLDLD
jgi:ribonuclease BN (tRNA processing enzyme)